MFKSKISSNIRFHHHPIFSKWAKPMIYGSGKLYALTKEESICQNISTGPALLCYNELAASILSKKLDKIHMPTQLTYKRHLVDMIDGGKVSVDEISNSGITPEPGYPSIVYCTSLAATSYTPRSKIWSNWFLQAGFPRVFIVNRRGSSRVPQCSPRMTLSLGKYNDLPAVMDYLVVKEPSETWIMIGSCYGANCVMNYLSQPSSDKNMIIGGIVDSFQFNGNKFLQRHYDTKNLYFKLSRAAFFSIFIEEGLHRAANPRVFDEVSRLVDRNKFKNLDVSSTAAIRIVYEDLLCKMAPDYNISTQEELLARGYPYYDNDHKNFMRIKKPLSMIYAQDDPFCPFDIDMIERIEENPYLCLWLFAGGGHISYTENVLFYTSFIKNVYLENALLMMKRSKQLL